MKNSFNVDSDDYEILSNKSLPRFRYEKFSVDVGDAWIVGRRRRVRRTQNKLNQIDGYSLPAGRRERNRRRNRENVNPVKCEMINQNIVESHQRRIGSSADNKPIENRKHLINYSADESSQNDSISVTKTFRSQIALLHLSRNNSRASSESRRSVCGLRKRERVVHSFKTLIKLN